MTKILLFNGPPRSGKDTAALHVLSKYQSQVFVNRDFPKQLGPGETFDIRFDRFAMPIKTAFAGLTMSSVDKYGVVEPFESTKDQIIPWLGVSYRQWQIDFSEKYMKPMYGIEIFARLFIERNQGAEIVVVPDSGFMEEAGPVVEAFGKENTLLVRTYRPGYDFTGDSRSYLPDVGIANYDVQNDGTQAEYEAKIDKIVGDFLAQ